MKILITGGAGYLGSVLVPALLNEGHEVTVLDNFYFQQNSLMECCNNERFYVIRGDCRDKDILYKAMKEKDVIIPLAALVGFPLCNYDKTAAETVNLGAINTLLSLREKGQKILYPCTNSGYGIGEKDQFCTEETPLKPISVYGTTKVQAEQAILEAGDCIVFRLATVFGASPRMRVDLLVNDFVYRAVTDRTAVIFEGHFKRNYIHIRDVARAFIHGLQNFEAMKDQPYNVGLSNANLSKLELCEEIKEQVPGFVYIEAPIGEDPDKRNYIVSNAKIERTGYQPIYSLEFGIKELIKCYSIIKNTKYTNI